MALSDYVRLAGGYFKKSDQSGPYSFDGTSTFTLIGSESGGGDASAANQTSQITQETAINEILGTTDGDKVITDANGTLQQYLRGLISAFVSGKLGVIIHDAAGTPLSTDADYETVAASSTDQILGATGAAGDFLAGVLIIPATTSPGAVSIKDGNGSGITIFTGGASSVSNLVPFFVPLGILSVNATTPGWKVTTGTNVSAIGVGDFT